MAHADRIAEAKARVESTLKAVAVANDAYNEACRNLAAVKLAVARETPHPWMGMQVYRVMKGEKVKHRIENGVVCFKGYDTPNYGNPHIQPGSYYVLVNNKTAHWLDNSWQLDLL